MSGERQAVVDGSATVATGAAEGEALSHWFELGLTYVASLDEPGNYARAFECWEKAAQGGNVRAAAELEILRRQGEDRLDGLLFLAERGDGAAQYGLSHAYANGHLAPLDPDKAAFWLNKAAESGNVDAWFALGAAHCADLASISAYSRAFECFERAAAGGHARAAAELDVMRRQAMERVDALRYLAERGDSIACVALARRYAEGNGVPFDPAAAMTCLRRAAEAGDCVAQYHLGVALAAGAGAARDGAEARIWLERAAAGGNDDARCELAAEHATPRTVAGEGAGFAEGSARVVVVGEGAFATRFASVLRRHGVVVEHKAGDRLASPAVVFVTEGFSFAPTGQVLCDFPAYFAALGCAADRFPRARLRHPAFAFALTRLSQPKSIGLFGLPGAGNTIFMRVIEELQREAGTALTTEQIFFQRLAELHLGFLIFAMAESAPALKGMTPIASNQRVGLVDLAYGPDAARGPIGHMFGLPCVNHSSPFLVCHGFDAGGLQRLDGHGFTSMLIARNPLDTIHSLINKYKKPFPPIVGDYYAFDLFAQGVTTYLARLAACADRYAIVRYEALLTDFETVTERLAAELRLPCDRALAERLKSTLLLKSLVASDPLHFRGGQRGAWKGAFDRRHFQILQRHGLPEIMKALGYPQPTAEDFEADVVTPDVVEPRNSLRMDLYFFHHLLDVPFPEIDGFGYGRVDGTAVGLRFEDDVVRGRLELFLQSPFGRILLNLVE